MTFQPQGDWHNEKCQWRDDREKVRRQENKAVRSNYCLTHNQWAYEFSIRTVATFADGTEYTIDTEV
jgi:hypothetical protein